MDKLKYEKSVKQTTARKQMSLKVFWKRKELTWNSSRNPSHILPMRFRWYASKFLSPKRSIEQARELLKSFDDILPKEDDEE